MRRASTCAAVAIAALVCVGSGCFTPSPLPVPAERIAIGRFSFLPPDEPGWITTPADQWSFKAAREGPSLDETYALAAELRQVEPYASDDELLAKGREQLLNGPPVSRDGRFEMKSADVELWKKLGARCLRVTIVTLDREPTRRSGSDQPMVMSAVSFWCVHPEEPKAGIILGLSQRCEEGKEDPALGEKAEALAATLEFLGPAAGAAAYFGSAQTGSEFAAQ